MINVRVTTSNFGAMDSALERDLVSTMALLGANVHLEMKSRNPVLTGRSRSAWRGSIGSVGAYAPPRGAVTFKAFPTSSVRTAFLASDGRRPLFVYNNTWYMDVILDRKDFVQSGVTAAEAKTQEQVKVRTV